MTRLLTRARRVWRRDGTLAAFQRALQRLALLRGRPTSDGSFPYATWIRENEPDAHALGDQRLAVETMPHRPLFSVVPCEPPAGRRQVSGLVASLKAQTYPHWELHLPSGSWHPPGEPRLVDGKPRGDWLVLLSRGALPAPDALFEAATRSAGSGDEVLYADNDLVDRRGRRYGPFLKPDHSPELLLSVDYLAPFLVVRPALVADALLPRDESEHWELSLRLSGMGCRIGHLSRILSHAFAPPSFAAGRAPVEASLRRAGMDARVEVTSTHLLRAVWPAPAVKVVVVIPTRDGVARLRPCLASLARTRGDLSVVVVDNGSRDPGTFAFLEQERSAGRMTLVRRPGPFNWSALNNSGARAAGGDVLAFLNDDIEALDAGWLEELLRWAWRPEVGVAGGLLRRADGSVQHAGVAFGLGGLAAHPFEGAREDTGGPLGRIGWYRDWLAVTGACQVMRREVFDRLGGFDESFGALFSDIDLCLRARRCGLRTVFTPFAGLVHHHGSTRGGDDLMPPHDFLVALDRFGALLTQGDPFFNPNLSRWSALPALRRRGEPDARRWLEVLAEVLRERYPGDAANRPQPVPSLAAEVDARLRAADARGR